MTLSIPTWLLWTLGALIGIPALFFLIACAVLGFAFAKCFGNVWRH